MTTSTPAIKPPPSRLRRYALRLALLPPLLYLLICLLLYMFQASLIYVTARLATPDGAAGQSIDMVAHFEATRRRFFEVLGLYMLLALAANQFIPGFGTLELKIIALSYSALFVTASRVANTNAQRVIAAITLGMTVYYCWRYMAGI